MRETEEKFCVCRGGTGIGDYSPCAFHKTREKDAVSTALDLAAAAVGRKARTVGIGHLYHDGQADDASVVLAATVLALKEAVDANRHS